MSLKFEMIDIESPMMEGVRQKLERYLALRGTTIEQLQSDDKLNIICISPDVNASEIPESKVLGDKEPQYLSKAEEDFLHNWVLDRNVEGNDYSGALRELLAYGCSGIDGMTQAELVEEAKHYMDGWEEEDFSDDDKEIRDIIKKYDFNIEAHKQLVGGE